MYMVEAGGSSPFPADQVFMSQGSSNTKRFGKHLQIRWKEALGGSECPYYSSPFSNLTTSSRLVNR